MAVFKYRSVEEMPSPPAVIEMDEAALRRIDALWSFAFQAADRRYPRGAVRKFRDIAAAQADLSREQAPRPRQD